MQISITVPYDEKRLASTITHILRRRMWTTRLFGALLVLGGVLLGVLGHASGLAVFLSIYCVIIGMYLAVALPWILIRRSLRAQSALIKDRCHMTIDYEWLTVLYPMVETRYRWSGLGPIVETPEGWHVMVAAAQALTIPKEPMSESERVVFSAFVHGLQPVSR